MRQGLLGGAAMFARLLAGPCQRPRNTPAAGSRESHRPCAAAQGTIPGHPHSYVLDDHHTFQTGKWYETCGSTGALRASAKGCRVLLAGVPACLPPPQLPFTSRLRLVLHEPLPHAVA